MLVLSTGALSAVGADQHVERLQVGRRGAVPLVVEQLLADQQCAFRGQALIDFPEKRNDPIFGPIMDDPAE